MCYDAQCCIAQLLTFSSFNYFAQFMSIFCSYISCIFCTIVNFLCFLYILPCHILCITSLYLFCMFLNNKIATIKTIIMMISLCSFLGNYVYFTHCFHGSWSSINWNEKGQWILFSSFNFLPCNESINCFTITIFSTVLVSCDNTQQRVSSMWNIT